MLKIERYQDKLIKDDDTKSVFSLKNDVNVLHELSKVNNNIDFAGRIIADENGDPVFNFGKHKGKKVVDVLEQEPSYYSWMMNGDFPLYTKKILTRIKLGAK